MENIMPFIIQAGELIGAAALGGWISRVLTIRARVRQETAGASKAEAEAKADQIENIRKTMDEVYKPIIDDLKRQVSELRNEVREVREENERLKDENDQLRDAIREIDPNIVPSRRSVNAQRQARGANGQFAKKEEK
jgi:peptidoglycan hydrolase CwlO-like protein